MIYYFPKRWSLLTYNGFKYHVNFTDGLIFFVEERTKVKKEEAGTSALNQVYDKLQAKKYKDQTKQLLEMAQQEFPGRFTKWQLRMIIFTATQNIPARVWIYYFVAVNLHPYHRLLFF